MNQYPKHANSPKDVQLSQSLESNTNMLETIFSVLKTIRSQNKVIGKRIRKLETGLRNLTQLSMMSRNIVHSNNEPSSSVSSEDVEQSRVILNVGMKNQTRNYENIHSKLSMMTRNTVCVDSKPNSPCSSKDFEQSHANLNTCVEMKDQNRHFENKRKRTKLSKMTRNTVPESNSESNVSSPSEDTEQSHGNLKVEMKNQTRNWVKNQIAIKKEVGTELYVKEEMIKDQNCRNAINHENPFSKKARIQEKPKDIRQKRTMARNEHQANKHARQHEFQAATMAYGIPKINLSGRTCKRTLSKPEILLNKRKMEEAIDKQRELRNIPERNELPIERKPSTKDCVDEVPVHAKREILQRERTRHREHKQEEHQKKIEEKSEIKEELRAANCPPKESEPQGGAKEGNKTMIDQDIYDALLYGEDI